MAPLPDHKILREIEYGELEIENFDKSQVQPCTVDIRLGNDFKEYKKDCEYASFNESISELMKEVPVPTDDKILVRPGEFILANTKEWFSIPDYLVGEVTGRSSIGRMGLTVHQTAGLFDPGFEGEGVLEIKNVSDVCIELQPGMRIAQIKFTRLEGSSNQPYGVGEDDKYQGQEGAVSSRIHKDIN